jgi:UDP-N-acetylglucosamine:LPS N-acetylglucosamine transferase
MKKNSENKIVLGLASIWAGGGHNALRDYLFEELENNEEFDIHQFTHSDSSYNFINDFFFGRFSTLYDYLYNSLPNDFPGVSALKLVKECEEFVRKVNPDIIVSTNFGVCSAFGLIKKTLKLNFVNIYAIPDYGKQVAITLPKNRYLKPDYIVVFDKDTKDSLVEMGVSKNKIILSGYLAKISFRKKIKDLEKLSKNELLEEIKKEIKDKDFNSAKTDKENYIITGGAGGTIQKSFSLLKKLVEYQGENPDFKNKKQFFIITGQNKKAYKKLTDVRKRSENWSNIFPVPWIEHKTYVKFQMLSDFPIMVTIAPATINEMIESKCGPFLVYKCREGQEKPILNFAIKNRLAYYLPNKNDALNKIIKGFSEGEKKYFAENSKTYRVVMMERVSHLGEVLMNIYSGANIPARKKDKFNLNIGIDLNKISPKILFTIFALILPAPIIFAYAQYFKQSHKIKNNKLFGLFSEIVSKLIPFKKSKKHDINA